MRRQYYLDHREEICKKVRIYEQNNPKKMAAYRRKNRKKRAAQSKVWRIKNAVSRKKYHMAYNRTPERRYATMKSHAKRREIFFNFPLEEYKILITNPCHYCHNKLNPTSGGLDRKNNSLGYEIHNVVPCCRECNVMKNTFLSYDEMVVVMRALLEYRGRNPK